jgi:heme oxygenase
MVSPRYVAHRHILRAHQLNKLLFHTHSHQRYTMLFQDLVDSDIAVSILGTVLHNLLTAYP